jgi:NADPH-dependent ferric siderophore reductase
MDKGDKAMTRVIARDENRIPRAWGEGETVEEAGKQAERAAVDYVRHRPDTGPLSRWTFTTE